MLQLPSLVWQFLSIVLCVGNVACAFMFWYYKRWFRLAVSILSALGMLVLVPYVSMLNSERTIELWFTALALLPILLAPLTGIDVDAHARVKQDSDSVRREI